MKYYITQTGREFIAEASARVKEAEDEARKKAIRDAKGKGLSPTQVGKLRGRAVHDAGRKAVEETP